MIKTILTRSCSSFTYSECALCQDEYIKWTMCSFVIAVKFDKEKYINSLNNVYNLLNQ